MKRKPSPATVIASVALFFSLGGSAQAASHPKWLTLTATAHRNQTVTACSRPLPAAVTIAVVAPPRASGYVMHTALVKNLGVFFVAPGTLVEVFSHPGRAPACMKITTWKTRVRITVRLSYTD